MLLDSWVLTHKQLEILEIHHHSWDILDRQHQLSICERLSVQNSKPPMIYIIGNFGMLLDRIIAFPAYSAHVHWSAKDIADSLIWSSPRRIDYFKLVLHSLANESLVHNVLTSLAEHFINLRSIFFLVQDPRIHTVCHRDFNFMMVYLTP